MKYKARHVKLSFRERLLWKVGKISRLRFWYLTTRFDSHILSALYVLVNSTVSMIIMGMAAHFTAWPMIFPSLGPTTFLIFYAASSPMSCPRNSLMGHVLGGIVGMICFSLSNLFFPEHATSGSFNLAALVIVGLSLGITGMVMVLSGLLHPPAASTAMMAAMGLFSKWYYLPVLVCALGLLCIQAIIMHRLAGVKFPLWASEGGGHGPALTTIIGRVGKDSEMSSGRHEKEKMYSDLAARLAARQKIPPQKGKKQRAESGFK